MTNTLHQSADASYCFGSSCRRKDIYCKEPRLDGSRGREIRDSKTDELLGTVSSSIKQCIANRKEK